MGASGLLASASQCADASITLSGTPTHRSTSGERRRVARGDLAGRRPAMWQVERAAWIDLPGPLAVERVGTTDGVRHPHVAVPGDVDLLIWRGLQRKHEASVALVRQLRDDQLVHLASKGAALWSLRSNAEQHPSVKALCDAEAGVAGGAGRRYLA